jgi:hypothetical protein
MYPQFNGPPMNPPYGTPQFNGPPIYPKFNSQQLDSGEDD